MAIDELPRVRETTAPRPAAEPAPRPRERTGAVSLAAVLLAFAAIVPLTRAVTPTWLNLAIVCIAAVWLTGAALRALRCPAPLVPVGQFIAWVGAATACHSLLAAVGLLPGPHAIAGVVPTPRLLAHLPPILDSATTEIIESASPFAPGPALTIVLIAAAGLLALVIDLLAVMLRLPLAAVVAALAVWVVPPAVTGADGDLTSIVAFAVAALLLLALDRRRRAPEEFRPIPAASVAAVAVVAALVIAPALPEPSPVLRGPAQPSRIDASLSLGDDLRRLGDTEVLRYTVVAGEAPYLRVATLSSFDGGRWHPDSGSLVPVEDGYEQPAPIPDSLTTAEISVQVQIANLEGDYMPVPSPLTSLTGAGDGWNVVAANLTVSGGEIAGESYTATATIPRPTLEQARAASAAIPSPATEGIQSTTVVLPRSPDLTPIREAAAEVTAGAGNDYDRLVALQSWFRSGEFAYSLDAPVEDGFDGTSFEAMARFLEQRSGYCVHYASTFAVMARTLGMPSRVVIGYLPGSNTGETLGDEALYSVMASQLHAWPEVYFRGIGWVPFEPTPGLGIATQFLPSSFTPDGADPDAPRPEVTAAPTPTASATASLPPEDGGEGAGDATGADVAARWLLALAIVAGAVLVLALPAIVRQAIRASRLRRAAEGDARAAWRELRATLVDAGLETPPHESPRALATRVADARDIDPALIAPLVTAIETASYGPGGSEPRRDLAEPVRQVRRALAPGLAGRALALLVPRSLFTLPRFGGSDGDG